MALTTAELTALAAKIGTDFPYLAIHTADPGSSGASPAASARVAHSGSAAAGALTISNVSFTGGAAGGAATYVGLWSASSAGTFGGGYQLTGDTTFNAAGQYTVTSLVITGSAT